MSNRVSIIFQECSTNEIKHLNLTDVKDQKKCYLTCYTILIGIQTPMTLKPVACLFPSCLSQNMFCYWQKMLSSKTLKNWYHYLAGKWNTDTNYFMIWFHKFFFSLLLPCRFDCCNTGNMLATKSSSKDHDGCQA